ncbi:pyrroloquinoline quinone-dependent dehydrogenase [Phenylobacterium montanum]|uniref:Pyrroloquinoline quinone-dependent dehydrogenase n=1 Tax=Phenylobacterium montanum TaxID=2823693 RepID=A0A975G0F8_9CAUL|nr:pyrroloquinoline quinone-dependent dehydrogenase [Caulobacter sp. S6]QUD88820.1 pyrroloquinoline quinone-dependent dehydrogenase [Caulobacter sp. S6]
MATFEDLRRRALGRSARLAMVLAGAVALAACTPRPARLAPEPDRDWPVYGGDQGGQRFSPARQITPQNVAALKPAWRFSTGDLVSHAADIGHSAFENTPIMAGGRVYVCSPFNEVFAVDPGTGQRIWAYDPRIDPKVHYPNETNCRGVAYWRDPEPRTGEPCAERIFLNTNDRRLVALDAATGRACPGFGQGGAVDVAKGVKLNRDGEMQITSPPVVARGVVVVGSSIDDNQRVQEVSGAVRAFDARTGAPLWTWDPLASAPKEVVAGAANVWAPMSVDEARGLVFLPTTSPSPDFWGGLRKGDDGDADSVVALDIQTGRKAWAFKTVHHDVWDYDNPAQPTLAMVAWNGAPRPAVLQPTKQGLLFTLGREDGRPVIPVEERPVPQGAAPGEVLSPTQPFPVAPKPLSPSTIKPDDAFGLFPWEKAQCRRQIETARHEGLFTPPSTQGTIEYPFTGGGSNWGGLAFDEARQVAYVNTSSAMHLVTLIPADKVAAAKAAEPDAEISPMRGAPFGMRRVLVTSKIGLPCNPPPWGQLHAIDMRTGKILWEVPIGTTRDLAPGTQFLLRGVGTPNFGGPLATASGLVFLGASLDNYLRAYDAASGRELWKGRLPGGGQATPMTYVWKGRQYVLIASGRHSKSRTKTADEVVAFALPQ